MKKIAILGGGANQIPLLVAAKNLGYYIILIDYRKDIIGAKYADVHYLKNATCFEDVYNVCLKEEIDGIVSNSDFTILVANRIAYKMHLNGNSPSCIESLMSKTKFRRIQSSFGFYCPISNIVTNKSDFYAVINNINYPIIVKPCECSGSRGSKVFSKKVYEDLDKCFEECSHLSRNLEVVVEEYIKMPSLTTIEGDIFIYNGQILWQGLFNMTRSKKAPIVPMTDSIPLVLDETKLNIVKETIRSIVEKFDIKFGEFNIEGYFTDNDNFFVIEINARQGGNDIPYFLKEATGIDYDKLLVSTAVGDDTYWNECKSMDTLKAYTIQHIVFSYSYGKYKHLLIDESIGEYVTRVKEFKVENDIVENCSSSTDKVAIVNVQVNSLEKYLALYNKMDQLITVELK